MIWFLTSADGFGLIELVELGGGVHRAERSHRFTAQLGRALGLRQAEQALPVSCRAEAADDGALHRQIGRRSIRFVEHLPVLRAADRPEIADRAQLQVGIEAALGRPRDDVAPALGAALAQDEERVLLDADGARAGEKLLDHRDRPLGVAVHQPPQREQLQLFARLAVWRNLIAGPLTDLDVERLRVLRPAALRKAFPHVREGGERVGALIQLPLRVRLPVERGVGPRAVRRGRDAIERLERAFVAAGIDQFTSLVVPSVRVARAVAARPGRGLRPRRRLVGEVRENGSGGNATRGGAGTGGTIGRSGSSGTSSAIGKRGIGPRVGSGGGIGWADATWPATTSELSKDGGTHSGHIVFLGVGEAVSRSRSRSESTRTRKSRAAASSRRRI